MGLFRSSKKKKADKDLKKFFEEHEKEQKKTDEMIQMLFKADAQYEKDGDLNKKIAVYEKVLDMSKEPRWNSFNQCMNLVKMYLDADRRDDAWRALNQMTVIFVNFPAYRGRLGKIRYEQFRILRSEKKYIDALEKLLYSHVISYTTEEKTTFPVEKFVKDAKTSAKSIGMTDEDLSELAQLIQKETKKRIRTEREITDLYRSFLKKKKLL